jgi:hypothetical protein
MFGLKRNHLATLVTRLGEFSVIAYFGQFLENYGSSPLKNSTVQVMH